MKLQQLRYLIAVAEEGSLVRAARRVGVAQPALTQQLKALEDSLKTKLLRRTTRGTVLTRGGEVMLQHARAILEQVSAAQKDVQEQTETVSGQVSLVVPNAIAETIVPELLRRAMTDYPQVSLRIQSSDSVSVRIALENARADVGIVPDNSALTSVNAKPLWNERMYLVAAADAALPQAGPNGVMRFRDAASYPQVVVERSNPLRRKLDDIAEEIGATLNIFAESNSLLMIRSYVESGIANAILPRSTFSDKLTLGAVQAHRIVEPEIVQSYIVAWPKTRPLTRAGEAIVQILVSVATRWEEPRNS